MERLSGPRWQPERRWWSKLVWGLETSCLHLVVLKGSGTDRISNLLSHVFSLNFQVGGENQMNSGTKWTLLRGKAKAFHLGSTVKVPSSKTRFPKRKYANPLYLKHKRSCCCQIFCVCLIKPASLALFRLSMIIQMKSIKIYVMDQTVTRY